jgi:uncharacterized protein YvpB
MGLMDMISSLEKLEHSFVGQFRHLKNLLKMVVAVAAAFALIMSGIAWLKADEQNVFAQDRLVFATTSEAFSLLNELPQAIKESAQAQERKLIGSTTAAATATDNVVHAAAVGWRLVDDQWQYYFADGSRATGSVAIGDLRVIFDDEGNWISSHLDVPYISQLPDMPFGCEVVSVTMMLNYGGVAVSKEELAAGLPYASDPNEGFTGNLYGNDNFSDGFGDGGIIWPPALLGLVQSYQKSARDLTGESWATVRGHIDQGKPVCIWFSEGGLDHTVLLTGYSDATVWVNDPLVDKDVALDLNDFLTRWAQNGYRALSY